jgi:two-component system response regulator NreC
MIKVLIADDHAIVRTGLRALIETDPSLELVGEAAGGYEALDLVETLKPDVLLLDISMPDLDGIGVIKKLQSSEYDLRVLMLTIHEDKALLREALKSGASGYVIKRVAEKELLLAIKIVMRGDMYIDPSMQHTLVETEGKAIASPLSPEVLTPREIDVLKLIVLGYTNRQIGEELNISVRTVEAHRANLTDKLGTKSRVELVRYARDNKLIT